MKLGPHPGNCTYHLGEHRPRWREGFELKIRTKIKNILRKLLLRVGFDIVPEHLIYDWQSADYIQKRRKIYLPGNAHEILRMDHPGLIALEHKYKETEYPFCEDTVWDKR